MMVLQFWETVKEAIAAYTGLSPAAFFTVLALAVAVYYAVSALFVSPGHHPRPRSLEEMVPLSPPVQLGEVTEGELKAYDGSDPKKPLLMAIKGQIYDVSQSRMFYGPGGPYALFAGRDASRALAKMSFEPVDLTGDVSGLGPFELEALQDWEYKFMSKYVKVGTIKEEEAQVSNGSTITEEPVAEAIDRDVVSPKSTAVESAEHGDPYVVSPKSTVVVSTDHGAAHDDDAAKYKSGIKEPLSPTDHGTGAVENAEAQVQNGVVGVNE